MSIYITGNSAIKIWDTIACKDSQKFNRTRDALCEVGSVQPSFDKHKLLNIMENYSLNTMDCLYSREYKMNNLIGLYCKTVACSLPQTAFVEFDGDIFLATPEFAYMQCLPGRDMIDCIKLGCELAGSASLFYYDSRGNQLARRPLFTEKSIQEFSDTCTKMHGSKMLRNNIKYIIFNTASEMEVKVAMLLFLPKSKGGYGLKGFVQNPTIMLSGIDAISYGYKNIRPDFYNEKNKVAIEYDGVGAHSEPDDMARDNIKDMIYAKMGIQVIRLNASDVLNEFAFHCKVKEIAELIDQRLQFQSIFHEKRAYLRSVLFQ